MVSWLVLPVVIASSLIEGVALIEIWIVTDLVDQDSHTF